MMGFGAGGFMGMTLFWLLVGGLFILVFARLIPAGRREDFADQAVALDVLETRFASGELSREDFEAMRRVLNEV